MTQQHSRRKTRKLLIYPRFQLRLVSLNVLILLAGFGFLAYQNYVIFAEIHEFGQNLGLAEGHPFYKFLSHQESAIATSTTIATISAIALSMILLFVLSHKLAGPVVRLKSYFGEIARSGKVSPLAFRKNDFFIELPEIINSALHKVQNKN